MFRVPRVMFEPLVRSALLEDLGRGGDLTSDAIVGQDVRGQVAVVARQPGVVAGLDPALMAFHLIDPRLVFDVQHDIGRRVQPGDVIVVVSGPARAMLTAERVALNFLGHLSGVATATASLVEAVRGTRTGIACTRKTTPGMRALEKAAVLSGGGVNHRFGLDDAILIKDNHLAFAGNITEAVRMARDRAGHLVKIEVEVDTLDQLRELLTCEADAVLLDNMTTDQLTEAVGLIDGRMIIEASGRITVETAAAIAATGVDLISVGWLTHSAPVLDFGLDYHG